MFPLLRHCVLLAGLTLLVTQGAPAQTPAGPPKAQQHPIPPPPVATDQEATVAYWTTETGWMSELQLRSNAVGQDLTVTPVLRLADGAETRLAPVTIKPQEVKSVDINAAIAAAGAPQLVGTYGSLVLRYRSAAQGNLYAALIFVVPGIGIICGGQPKRTRHKADCAEPRAGSWFRGRKLNSGKGDDE